MNGILGALLASATAAAASLIVMPPSTASVMQPAPARVAVEFGETVRQGHPDESLQLAFTGRRGQLVALQTEVGEGSPSGCESVALRRGGTKIAQSVAHVWRLPADGSYLLDYSQTCVDPFSKYPDRLIASVVLSRVAVTPARLGERLRLGVGRAVIRAASVLLADRPILFTGASVVPASALRTTDDAAERFQGDCNPTTLSAGQVPATEDESEYRCDFRARAGDRYLVFGDDSTRVESYAVARAVLDGRPVPIGDAPRQITFSGRAGDVVYHESRRVRLATRPGDGVWLITTRDGFRVAPLERAAGGIVDQAWVLPRTGTYRLRMANHVARSNASVRLRTARLTEIPVGQDVVLPVVEDRWVFAVAVPSENSAYEGIVRATSRLAEGWGARLMSGSGTWSNGGPAPLREIGAPTGPVFALNGVLLKPGAGQRGTGSVTLRLNACPYDPAAGALACPAAGVG